MFLLDVTDWLGDGVNDVLGEVVSGHLRPLFVDHLKLELECVESLGLDMRSLVSVESKGVPYEVDGEVFHSPDGSLHLEEKRVCSFSWVLKFGSWQTGGPGIHLGSICVRMRMAPIPPPPPVSGCFPSWHPTKISQKGRSLRGLPYYKGRAEVGLKLTEGL
jgi:hypothetical protein